MRKALKSFTLMELMLVIIVAAALSALALVRFNQTIEKANYDKARMNLIAIHSATIILNTQDDTIAGNCADLAAINTKLKTGFSDSNFNYSFTGSDSPMTFSATAQRTTGAYQLQLAGPTPISAGNPACVGTCP